MSRIESRINCSRQQDEAFESTNPFSEGHVERRLLEDLKSRQQTSSGRTRSVPENCAENQVDVPQRQKNQAAFLISDLEIGHLNDVRLLIQPDNPSHFKKQDGRWEFFCRRASFRDPPDVYVECFTVTQPREDVSYQVREPFNCDLYYDTYADSITVKTRSMQPSHIERLAVADEDHPISKELEPFDNYTIYPGPWRFSVPDGKHAFQIMVFPRTYSLSLLHRELPELAGSKRRRSEEQEKVPSAASIVGCSTVTELLKSVADIVDGSWVRVAAANLEDYRLLHMRTVGSTNASVVFQAKISTWPDRIVVVKVFKNTSNPITRGYSWLREFNIHRKLQSKVIAEFLGGDARLSALFIQWVDARDLRHKDWRCGKYRDRQYFTGDHGDATRILQDMALALKYLSSEGIVHNDIKPGNILYSRETGAVLIDFGLATLHNTVAYSAGTPWYVAPEYLYSGERQAASDIWALGVVMLYLLKKVPLPECHVEEWSIREVREPRSQARRQMENWLRIIKDATEGLIEDEYLDGTVLRMLEVRSRYRITANDLVQSMIPSQGLDTM